MKVLVVMNVMGVMRRLKTRFNWVVNQGEYRLYTTISGIIKLEKWASSKMKVLIWTITSITTHHKKVKSIGGDECYGCYAKSEK